MNGIRTRFRLAAMVLGLMALAACVAAGPGNDGYAGGVDVGVDYGVNYYEPGYYDYSGWRPGWHVGPPRRDAPAPRPSGQGVPRPPPRAPSYRPAPASHSMPSIPNRPRR